MSTRAFRKLHLTDEIQKLAEEGKESSSDDETKGETKSVTQNPFALVRINFCLGAVVGGISR